MEHSAVCNRCLPARASEQGNVIGSVHIGECGSTLYVGLSRIVRNLIQKSTVLEKWFPLQGERGHSSYFGCFQKQNREEGETEQAYQFTQCHNILHRLQVHHLILTFIIHNKYIIYIHTYIHTYIHIYFVLVNFY